jgi:hypothetical protein
MVFLVRSDYCVMVGFDQLRDQTGITKGEDGTIVDSLHGRLARHYGCLQLGLFGLLDILEGRDHFFSGLNLRTRIRYLLQYFFFA